MESCVDYLTHFGKTAPIKIAPASTYLPFDGIFQRLTEEQVALLDEHTSSSDEFEIDDRYKHKPPLQAREDGSFICWSLMILTAVSSSAGWFTVKNILK